MGLRVPPKVLIFLKQGHIKVGSELMCTGQSRNARADNGDTL